MQFRQVLLCMMTPKNVIPKVYTTLAVSQVKLLYRYLTNTEKPEK